MKNVPIPMKLSSLITSMTNEDAGCLLKRIVSYAEGATTPSESVLAEGVFSLVKPPIDKAAEASERHKESGKSGGRPPKKKPPKDDAPESAEPEEKPPKAKRFTPPTLEEVEAYCLERGINIDPEYFMDYYTTNGWKQSNGNPVKDWKACVRTWEHNEKMRRSNQQSRQQQMPPAATPFGGNTRKDPFQQLKEKMRQEGTLGND